TPQSLVNAPVPIAAVVLIEEVPDSHTDLRILIRQRLSQPLIEIRTAREPQTFKEFSKGIKVFEGINHCRFLSVCQLEEVDARAFFYELTRLLQNIALQAQFAHLRFQVSQFPK